MLDELQGDLQEELRSIVVSPTAKNKQSRFLQSQPKFEEYLNSPTGSPVLPATDAYQDTTGTPTAEAADQRAKQLEQQVALHEQGSLEEWMLASQTIGTAAVIRTGLNWMERTEPDDPNFKLSAEELTQVLDEYDITGTDNVIENLHEARSMQHVQQIARDVKEIDEINSKLQNAGVKSFLVHALDPIENAAMFGAAAITGGAGGLSVAAARAAKAAGASSAAARNTARGVHGGGQAVAVAGALGLHSAAGVDVTLTDYILGAGLGIAIGGLTMPRKAVDDALGHVEVTPSGAVRIHQPVEAPSAKTAKAAAEAPATPKVTPATARTAVQSIVEAPNPAWSAPEIIRRLRTGAEGATALAKDSLKRLEAGLQKLSSKGVKVRAGDLEQVGIQQIITRAVEAAAETVQAGTATKALQKQVKALEEQAEAAGKTLPEYVQDAVHGTASPEGAEALNRFLGTNANDIPWVHSVVQNATVPKELPAVKAEAPTGKAPEAAAAEPAAPAEGVNFFPSSSTTDAIDLTPTGRLEPTGNILVRAGKYVSKGVKEFLGEYDKLTGGKEVLRNFLQQVLDDPLNRFKGAHTASTQLRINQNMANTEHLEYTNIVNEYVLKATGQTWADSRFGYSTEFLDTKLKVERSMSEILAERDRLKGLKYSTEDIEAQMLNVDAEVLDLVHTFEKQVGKTSGRARQQNLMGFEEPMNSVGYWSRKWTYSAIKGVDDRYGAGTAANLIVEATRRANPEMSALELRAVTKATIDRAKEFATGSRSDYMGQLGRVESEHILDILKLDSSVDPALVESVARRLKQATDEQGIVSFAKDRIDMDMTTRMELPDGTSVSLLDLIDTNLSSNLKAYQTSMAGRSALASVGIGGGVHGADTFIQHYRDLVDSTGIPEQQANIMQNQLRSAMSDFTGVKPDTDILHPAISSAKDMAAATLLAGSGLWQVVETGMIMSKKGAYTSMKYMLKNAPVLRGLFKELGNSSSLHKEFEFVTGMSYQNDVRMQPFIRQQEINLGSMAQYQKYTHSAREFSSTINGLRWVHGMQTRMLTNLNMLDIYKASTGDARALEQARRYGADSELLDAVKRVSVTKGGALKGAGLEGLSDAEMQKYLRVMTNMQDTALLFNRTGWGSGYARSALGQILGQFTSYVSMAHNVILRGTYHQDGAMGVASVLAHSLPFSAIAGFLQEARKGNVLDLGDDDDLMELMQIAFRYAPAAGYLGDITSVVSGSYNTRGAAALQLLETPGNVTSAFGDMAKGDPSQAAVGLIKAGSSLSVLGAFPGMRLLQDSLENNDD